MANIASSDFPIMILATIASCICGSEPVCLPFRATDERSILRLVARRWDVLIRSRSALWDHIHFTPPFAFYTPPEVLLNQFTTCTTRSADNPLAITFDMGRNDWPFSIVHRIILPNVRRIQKLTCTVHTSADIFTFLTIPEGHFGILESLNICFINTWTNPLSQFSKQTCRQFDALRTAPMLRNVTAHLVNGLHPINLHLPWSQITSIDFGTVAMLPKVFIAIIRHGSLQLQEAFFHVCFSNLISPHDIVDLAPHKIILCKLRKLRLRLIYPSRDKRLFSILQLPSLTHMWVEMHDDYQDWDLPIYIKFLHTSASTLQQLCLSDYPPAGPNNQLGYSFKRCHRATVPSTLEKLFKTISNVNNLYLPLSLYIHASTVEKIASGNLLPKLCLLELGASIASGWHLLSMVEKRREHVVDGSLGLGNSLVTLATATAPQLTVIRYVSLFIPYCEYTVQEEVALSQQRRFLASHGISVHIEPTVDLPLPMN